jgi:5'-3' exoribonuclease 1
MGIPSYFSHLIRQYGDVLFKYANIIQDNIVFDRLYMDCNSILYDSYRKIDVHETYENMERLLLEKTGDAIENYIHQIKPSQYIYIAFDGVAPLAKMEQQRNRRYKSWFETCMMQKMDPTKEVPDVKKTTCIFTPGTPFMNKLCVYMKKRFLKQERKYRVKQIIVATPDEPGEGEHKLFAHMREVQSGEHETSVVYGLDADLLMLSLFHLKYVSRIFVFRESPQFGSLKKANHDPDEPLFLDMAKLARSIAANMNCKNTDNHRMCDYIFMCFLLGNDFLPHFPALNIRTGGINILLDTYRITIGNVQERFLVSRNMEIQWKEVYRFINALAKNEYHYICQEYATRRKWDEKPVDLQPKKTLKEKTDLFLNTPMLYRKEEKYICPYESGWEGRYYEVLFSEDAKIQDVCVNYLEGLQWVFDYYTKGVVNWVWKYKYSYAPLLKDLAPKVPIHKMQFHNSNTKPVSPQTQLAYVLPPIYHFLLEPSLAKKLRTQYKDDYVGLPYVNGLPNLEFKWAFCRYFWEAHVSLGEPRFPHTPS